MLSVLLLLMASDCSFGIFKLFLLLIFSFICMFCRSLFVLLYFFFWSLCCLFFFYLWLLIAPLVSSNYSCYSSFVLYVSFVDRCLSFYTFFLVIVLSVLLLFMASDCSFGIFKLFPETDIINMLGFLIDNMLCLMDMI